MEDETYEIIYDKGVPVIAFQICTETENDTEEDVFEEEEEEMVDCRNAETDYEENNQTLQYFKEDETDQVISVTKEMFKPAALPPKVEKKPLPVAKELPIMDDENLDFVIVKNATKCNSKKLYDVLGYSYTLRNVSVKEGCSFWRCRFKVDDKECGAKIKITSEEQLIVIKNHRHHPDTSVSFALLKETRMEPAKPKPVKPASKPTHKSSKSPRSKHFSKSHSTTNRRKNSKCEKMLDYFSESQHLHSFDSEDISRLISEQEKEDEVVELEGESSLPEHASTTKENTIRFKVIKNGSITGTHILYDSLGYSYNIIQRRSGKCTWGCHAVLTSNGTKCGAQVCQMGTEFSPLGIHSHPPKRHTLLKISKMQIFSSQNNTVSDQGIKRKSPQKSFPSKKIRKEKYSAPISLTTPHIKQESESFEFNTRDISFMVSLENDENEPSQEGNVVVKTEAGRNDMDEYQPKQRPPRVPKKGRVLMSRTVPHPFNEKSFSVLKEMAILAFTIVSPDLSRIKYHVVENGSSQGGPKLYDSRGYFYTIRSTSTVDNEVRTVWFCCSRGEKYNCRAKVNQRGSNLFSLERDHCHTPDKEKFVRSLIRMEAVEMVKDPANLRRSGMSIVKGILDGYGIEFPFNINVDHLVRFVNYQKKSFMEHNEIANCRYTFNKKKIPKNFLLDKIMTDYKFHLTFATENQLAYLASAAEWYVDEADFDVPPFTTVFSVHVYTHHADQPRQTPVFFALISERRENDYTQVFSSIKAALNHAPSVSSIIIDLNIPLRRSILKSFPDTEIKCCDLHWSEDISNKLKEMDLSHFFEDPGAMNYLYQLPLLNLLPRQDFETALCDIEKQIEDDSVQDLICYIRETFGERSLWTPKYWSAFKMPIQINDHELWRKDILTHNSRSELEVYSFIRTLYLVSKSVGDDLRLMSKKKIKKHYLSRPETTLFKVYQEWKSYCKGEKDCHRLLEKLASIIHVF